MIRIRQFAFAAGCAAAAFLAFAQSPTPKFEVASIRPVKQCGYEAASPSGDAKKSGPPPGRGGGGGAPTLDPDRLTICGPVRMLINVAYVVPQGKGVQANPAVRFIPDIPIEGGPDWLTTDSYAINAKPETPVSREVMSGPMLQSLLEDRFKLKIRRLSRDGPAYAMTVAKGGPKLTPSTCIPGFFPDGPPPGRTPCPLDEPERRGSVIKITRRAVTLDEYSLMLSMDRPVVNKTGISGVYDIQIQFAPDDTTPLFLRRVQNIPDSDAGAAPDPAGGPSIFTALQEQLGLKLEPTLAPREVLVIDSIQRPSDN